MSKYGVTIIWSERGYIEVEANNEDDAMDKAQEALDYNDVEVDGDGDYQFEVEKLDK